MMEKTLGERVKQTAEEMRDRLGEAVHTAGERLGEMREIQRITTEIRSLKREKERCRQSMADLLMRMFDQNTFAEALLRPEYNRIKEIDVAISTLEEERIAVRSQEAAATTPPPAVPIEAVQEDEEAAEVDMTRCE
ncbi:MAG: hypothetical protein ACYC7E_08785 [Armatimonadota bacterium]